MPRGDFIAWVRTLPNAVAVIPLEDSRFAACKSAIKWMEYAEAGIPVLCSDVRPYRDVIESGRTGWLVANEAEAWDRAIQTARQLQQARAAHGAWGLLRLGDTLGFAADAVRLPLRRLNRARLARRQER